MQRRYTIYRCSRWLGYITRPLSRLLKQWGEFHLFVGGSITLLDSATNCLLQKSIISCEKTQLGWDHVYNALAPFHWFKFAGTYGVTLIFIDSRIPLNWITEYEFLNSMKFNGWICSWQIKRKKKFQDVPVMMVGFTHRLRNGLFHANLVHTKPLCISKHDWKRQLTQ